MKWNGIVSQLGTSPMATRFARANAAHASSTRLRRSDPIPAMPHRLDRRIRAELLPQPPDADIDHVRARIEVVAPHVGEQALTAHHFALVQHEVVEEAKLAVRELAHDLAEPRLPPREIERQHAGRDHRAVATPL